MSVDFYIACAVLATVPVYFAAVQGTLFMVAVWKMHQRQKDETTGEPAQFVPMVRTTPTALEMHPDDSEQSPDLAPDVAHGTSVEFLRAIFHTTQSYSTRTITPSYRQQVIKVHVTR